MDRRQSLLLFASAVCLLAVACEEEVEQAERIPDGQEQKLRLIRPGLALPKSARNVWAWYTAFLDEIQLVRFDADLTEARVFAAAALGHPAKPGDDPLFEHHSRKLHFWLREFPRNGEGGKNETSSPYVELALQPAGCSARVWLELFTT